MEQAVENKNIRNILFVDNDHGFANEIKDLVKRLEVESKHGYHIDHAGDLVSAMKQMEKTSYELVVLELVLPILSGYLLIDRIKKTYSNTRIIVYTRLKAPQDLAKTAASGVDNIYLKELISIEEVVKQIIQGDKPGDMEETLKRLNEKSKELMSQEVRTNNLLTQCSKCHLMIPPDSYFCNNCGQKVAKKEGEILLQKPADKKENGNKAVEIKNQANSKDTEVKDDGKNGKQKEKDESSTPNTENKEKAESKEVVANDHSGEASEKVDESKPEMNESKGDDSKETLNEGGETVPQTEVENVSDTENKTSSEDKVILEEGSEAQSKKLNNVQE